MKGLIADFLLCFAIGISLASMIIYFWFPGFLGHHTPMAIPTAVALVSVTFGVFLKLGCK